MIQGISIIVIEGETKFTLIHFYIYKAAEWEKDIFIQVSFMRLKVE